MVPVPDLVGGIGRGFHIKEGGNGSVKVLEDLFRGASGLQSVGSYSPGFQEVANELAGATVQGGRGHQHRTGFEQAKEGGGDGRHAAFKSEGIMHPLFAPFNSQQLSFHRI